MLPEGKAWYGRHGSMQHVRDKSIKRTVPPARLEEIFECEEGLRLNRTPRARSAAVTQCVDCVGVRMDQELLPITVFKRKLDADRDGLCNGVAASHCLPRARRDTAKAHTPAVENLVADVELRPGGVQVDPLAIAKVEEQLCDKTTASTPPSPPASTDEDEGSSDSS